MIRPLALYIGLRYTRAKKRNHFISFISLISMLGIALGVAVLIIVLSVMNGFDFQIRKQFFALAPEVTVLTNQNISNKWPLIQKIINQNPEVINSAPYVNGFGVLSNSGVVNGVSIVGIIPSEQNKISILNQKITDGSLSNLATGNFNIVVGEKLANELGLELGDKVNLFTPQATTTPLGVFPSFRRFTVAGIFNTHGGFGFDSNVAYINLRDAYKLYPNGVAGLHVKINNIYRAQVVTRWLQQRLPSTFGVTNWALQNGSFFNALTMEKTILFVILLLIVCVAVFNLVATLVMVVNDKYADIAILRTLGASPRIIMSIFVIQGVVVGIIGTVIGVIIGIIIALNATALVNWLQHLFNIQVLKSSVFFVDFLPSRLEWKDVAEVCSLSMLLSLLATLYPASIAFKTQPAEALRYE